MKVFAGLLGAYGVHTHVVGVTPDLAGAPRGLLIVTAGFVLVIIAFSLPFNRMAVHSELAKIEAVRATHVDGAIKSAAWRTKKADANAKLAYLRYWNGTLFDWWIPDEVEKVPPL